VVLFFGDSLFELEKRTKNVTDTMIRTRKRMNSLSQMETSSLDPFSLAFLGILDLAETDLDADLGDRGHDGGHPGHLGRPQRLRDVLAAHRHPVRARVAGE